MDSLAKSDIFFVITSFSVVIITILAAVALIYGIVLINEARKPEAADTVIGATGSVADCAGEKALADAGGSCDDDIEAFADPAQVGDLSERSSIDAAGGLQIQILKGSDLCELGLAQPLAQSARLTFDELVLDQQAEPLLEVQVVGGERGELLLERSSHTAQSQLMELLK